MIKYLIFLFIFVLIMMQIKSKEHPQAKLYFTDYCKYFNYPVEIHDVITQDGYILRLFRVQRKGSTIKQGLKPIYLQHGLLDCSDTWIINDQDKAPGFMLANRGYDVWFGNSRGNKHSRKHKTLNPDKGAQFWKFTFQDMADYDIPAVLKYIYDISKQKIHYLGHSQGTVMIHVALSKQNSKVQDYLDKYFGFGPVAYINYQTSPIFKPNDFKLILQWFKIRHIYQFMPSFNWFQTDLGVLFCAEFPKFCGDIMKYIMDADPSQDNYYRYDVLVGHDPAGTSITNMHHWFQMSERKVFGAFDFGSAEENQKHYNQPYPPLWNLTNIRVSVHFFAGSSDQLADLTDVNYMWSLLKPEVKTFLKVYNAGHCTFMWGINVNPWMNDLFSFIYPQQEKIRQKNILKEKIRYIKLNK